MVFIKVDPYLYGAIGIFVGIMMILIILYSKKSIVKKETHELDPLFVSKLITSLGGIENIFEVSSEHQRLKIKVLNLKSISANELKALDLGAFLKGKEVTLLIKKNIKDVITYINDLRKED